jgi:carbon storage regulator
VTVIDIRGKSIKLGFTFPSTATVLRREIHERIQAENRAAEAGQELPPRQAGKKGAG